MRPIKAVSRRLNTSLPQRLRENSPQPSASQRQWSTLRRTDAVSNAFSSSMASGKDVGKPVSTVVSFRDLPQGLLDGDLLPLAEETPVKQYPTVIRDARSNMQKFENCVLLTRVGSFYELYFEQAEEFGPLLNIKVASKKTGKGPVPMAGFPFFQLERFLKILVQDLGRHVAISEQSEDTANDSARQTKSGGLMFDRQVSRVITPGTLIDESFLSPFNHNYLLAIDVSGVDSAESVEAVTSAQDSSPQTERKINPIGLAWLDLSSGDFYVQSSDLSLLSSDLARIGPKEILIEKSVQNDQGNIMHDILKDCLTVSYFDPQGRALAVSDWVEVLEDQAHMGEAANFDEREISAANILLQYVKKQLPGLQLRLQAPKRHNLSQIMGIDKNSLRGLEIRETVRHNAFKGSLLQVIRRTRTESGARLLARRLTSPSTSLTEIQNRLNLVEHFLKQQTLLTEIESLLQRTHDTLRLLQKFSFGKGDVGDLLGFARTITITNQIGDVLVNSSNEDSTGCISDLVGRFARDGLERIASRITDAIDQDGLTARQRSQEESAATKAVDMARSVLEQSSVDEPEDRLSKRLKTSRAANKHRDAEEERLPTEDIWIMRSTATPNLRRLHENLEKLQNDKIDLGIALREKTGATSLSLRWTPGLGHICHVKGKDMKISLESLEDARIVGSSKSTKSFYLPEWTKLGAKFEATKSRIRGEEQNIFGSLRDSIIRNLVSLRRNASILDEIDVACSFALLADELDLKRPLVNQTLHHKVIGGRHPTVESGLTEMGRQFTPNHCILHEKERIWLITGPNMAGKSTFLRQNALISILAQTGSFVPAEYAELGIVDQIFSRVGSADNLSQNQSTFMVEMLETSYILRHATSRSFVIMDEVGRGTTPEDGTAVGYAVLHHLHQVTGCRTLFATHFHALADMTQDFAMLARYCTNVIEEPNGAFRYDHRMKTGVNREPHALKVARLAGLPESIIAVASDVLSQLKFGHATNDSTNIREREDKANTSLKAQAA